LLITDDPETEAGALEGVRNHVALYVGGKGAKGENFYNSLFARHGYADEAESIQELYLAGKKREAAAAVPDEFVRSIALVGPIGHIQQRVRAYRGAGVSCLIAEPLASSHPERVEHLAQPKQHNG
jgi:hypothetical protein